MSLFNSAILPRLLLVSFFLIFSLLFTGPVTDGDCFWHLATGRWIAENSNLPVSDPLSFTVTDHNPFRPESGRVMFLLKQYWLGQLALFGIWKVAGIGGIVLLRAAVYTGIMAALYFWMRTIKRGVMPLFLIALVGLLLREIPNERPQLFSFIFMPSVLYLLEQGVRKGRQRPWVLAALPLVMIVWANTHGAYILGVVLIAISLGAHLFAAVMSRKLPDTMFIAAAVAGMVVTAANPAGTQAWNEAFLTVSAYTATVYENLTPWYVAVRLHDLHPAYWTFLIVCTASIAISWRRMAVQHLLVLVSLLLLSLTGLRYMVYPLLAAPLLAPYLPEISPDRRSVSVLAIGLLSWIGCTWDADILKFSMRDSFPVAAAAFIRQQQPAPYIFNHYDWGGYLSWSVPGLKTFIDGRGLVEEISLEQDKVMNGENWRQTLDRYGINTVVIPGMDEVSGRPYPITSALAAVHDWQLVFADDRTTVFVRDIPANRALIAQFRMDKRNVQNHLVTLANHYINENPGREEYWQTKADALQLLGDRTSAMVAYKRVLQLNPDNMWARRMLTAGGN